MNSRIITLYGTDSFSCVVTWPFQLVWRQPCVQHSSDLEVYLPCMACWLLAHSFARQKADPRNLPPLMNVISFLMLDKPVSRTNWVWKFFFYHPQNQSQSSWTLCIRHRISPSSNSNILRRMLSLFLPLTNFPISLL